ncbi:MAG: amidohydrolase family protein [Anaerolineae bacterium]|nr:amidohydrolase family protein [Anaerolineae bacterium]
MIIDFHIHIGDFRSLTETKLQPVTWENLFQRMDDEGIDKAVLLPVFVSSENYIGPRFITEGGMDARTQVLEAQQYLDRIIPFGNLDCRWLGNSDKADYSPLLDWFQEHNCVGIGEVTSNVPIDDPRNINMFRQCGDRGLPVTIHNVGYLPGTYGLQDFPGMPGLAKLLETCPQTNVLGHGQGFWAEMGAGISMEDKMRYPKGPITEEGALPKLMRRCPNLYGDLSAGSGHNAITRDPEYGIRFINEFQDRLLFATDVCFGGLDSRMPHLNTLRGWLSEGKISQTVFDKVTHKNGLRLIGQGE